MAGVLIYGHGESGRGAAKLLEEMDMEFDFVENAEGDNSDMLDGVEQIVLSPGVPCDVKLVKEAKTRGVEVIGEVELAYRHCLSDIIAVTGTNGKTTTVELIAAMLNYIGVNAQTLGNIGKSFAERVLGLGLCDVAVVELSSFQLETINKFRPKYAICTNISPDHLERHGTMDNYITCKRRIFMNQTPSDYAILNYDDEEIVKWSSSINSNTYYFSTRSVVRGAYIVGNSIYFKDKSIEYVCGLDCIAIKGEHNLRNALAMVTLAKILNIPNSAIERVLSEFSTPPNRIEFVAKVNGVNYYNDSKATNIDAASCACHSMQGKTVLLMGGYDKGLDYKAFFEQLPLKIGTIIVYGANRKLLVEQSTHICGLTVIEAQDLAEAVEIAAKVRVDNVLLSPATSSYDAYKNYEERGNHFTQLVHETVGGND